MRSFACSMLIILIAVTVSAAETVRYFDYETEEEIAEGEIEGRRYITVTYDERGEVTSTSYFDELGKPLYKKYGSFGKACRVEWFYDEHGRETGYLIYKIADKNTGKIEINKRIELQYAPYGYMDREYYYYYENGVAASYTVYECDESGNRLSDSLFKADGTASGPGEEGIHRTEWTYDENGYKLSESYFGKDGQPITIKYGISRLTNAGGGSKGGGPNYEGTHRMEFERDINGNAISASYFGANDEPVADGNGVHRIVGGYDKHANLLVESYFGKDGKPTVKVDVHRIEKDYDGSDRVIATRRYGAEGESLGFLGNDYFTRSSLDDLGNVISMSYFSYEGEPTVDRNGVHREERTYIGEDKVTSTSYFGIDEEPVSRRAGIHKTVTEYGESGFPISTSYYGISGNPVFCYKQNYHRLEEERDSFGRLLERRYIGLDNEPIARSDQDYVATIRYEYLLDEPVNDPYRSKLTSESVFGQNGLPTVKDNWHITFKQIFHFNIGCGGFFEDTYVKNVHKIEIVYNDENMAKTVDFFGINNEPVVDRDGVHRYEYEWYDDYNPYSVTCFNYEGRKIKGQWPGYVRIEFRYNTEGKIIEKALYDENDEPLAFEEGVHKMTIEQGDSSERDIKYFDVKGKPIEGRFRLW